MSRVEVQIMCNVNLEGSIVDHMTTSSVPGADEKTDG